MYSAKIIRDSISSAGARITTFEFVIPRIVLCEFNTHRSLCLAGDSILEFSSPRAQKRESSATKYPISIENFYRKWTEGAQPRPSKNHKILDMSLLDDNSVYTTMELKNIFGFSNYSGLNGSCRSGLLKAVKELDGRQWLVLGSDFKKFYERPRVNNQPIQYRLKDMTIRQINEHTNKIQYSTVVDCFYSGRKEIFEVKAGRHQIAGSKDHKIWTDTGYVTIENIIPGTTRIAVRRLGKPETEKLHRFTRAEQHSYIMWNRKAKLQLIAEMGCCQKCGSVDQLRIHHIQPRYLRPDLVADKNNVTLLCEGCHRKEHEVQGWQTGFEYYVDFITVDSINYRGVEDTYDLEIAGEFPNFFANGIVVHNSRNSASSRAIPVERKIKQVMETPFIPLVWATNKKGMQGGEPLSVEDERLAIRAWLNARDQMVLAANYLSKDLNVHKSIANRLIEPFAWQTIIATATDWQNYFTLRCHELAQPEIQLPSFLAMEAYDESIPKKIETHNWHLPYISDEEVETMMYCGILTDEWGYELRSLESLISVSAGRCARVSVLGHDGSRSYEKDLGLNDGLLANNPPHASPTEHQAIALKNRESKSGNFTGWGQNRKRYPNECSKTMPSTINPWDIKVVLAHLDSIYETQNV